MVRRELGEYAAFIASKPWPGGHRHFPADGSAMALHSENSFIVFNLQPDEANIRKRLVKSQVMK